MRHTHCGTVQTLDLTPLGAVWAGHAAIVPAAAKLDLKYHQIVLDETLELMMMPTTAASWAESKTIAPEDKDRYEVSVSSDREFRRQNKRPSEGEDPPWLHSVLIDVGGSQFECLGLATTEAAVDKMATVCKSIHKK